MIGVALGLELRTLLRSPLRMLALAMVLGTGVFVILQGQRDVDRWEEAIASARAEEEESLNEARELLAAGLRGPEDKPWIDLSMPSWQDRYAATRLAREPAPLAGIAFASAEVGAVAMRVGRFSDPLLPQGTKLENPEITATGGLDLVTVLALLLPLMILAMGIEIGGYERVTGILPLVRVQSGRDRSWIGARCLAVGLLAAVAGVFLAGVACGVAGVGAKTCAILAVLVLAYVAFWTAVLLAVALFARHPSQGAVAMGAAWLVVCVLIPAIGVERSASLAADDFAVDLTVEARDAGRALSEMEEKALVAALLVRFPDLEGPMPKNPSSAVGMARSGMRIVGIEERMASREERGDAQERLVQTMGFVSPAVAFTYALEQLAGRGPGPAVDYRRAVVAAVADRMERYIANSWDYTPLGSEEFEELHASTPQAVASSVRTGWRELALMVAWAIVVGGLAWVLSKKSFGTAPRVARSEADSFSTQPA